MKNNHPRVKRMFSSMFQFRTWSMYDQLVAFIGYVLTGAKNIFVVQPSKKDISFDEIIKSKKISDETLQVQKKSLLRLSLILLFTAIIILLYATYSLINNGSFNQFVVSISLCMVACAFAFRYHYYYYQLKTKQLGCSIKQWWRKGILHK